MDTTETEDHEVEICAEWESIYDEPIEAWNVIEFMADSAEKLEKT